VSQIVVQDEAVVFDQRQQEKEDEAVDKLLAGRKLDLWVYEINGRVR
jgi:hypothetical protein